MTSKDQLIQGYVPLLPSRDCRNSFRHCTAFLARLYFGVIDSVKIWPRFSMRVQPFLSTSFIPRLGLVHPRQVGVALPMRFTTFKIPFILFLTLFTSFLTSFEWGNLVFNLVHLPHSPRFQPRFKPKTRWSLVLYLVHLVVNLVHLVFNLVQPRFKPKMKWITTFITSYNLVVSLKQGDLPCSLPCYADSIAYFT